MVNKLYPLHFSLLKWKTIEVKVNRVACFGEVVEEEKMFDWSIESSRQKAGMRSRNLKDNLQFRPEQL